MSDDEETQEIYTVHASVGDLCVSVDGESIEEASKVWQATWKTVVEDIEDMSEETKEEMYLQ